MTLSRLAMLLLVLTSLAPVLLVQCATLLPDEPVRAAAWGGAALLFAGSCAGLLAYAGRRGEVVTFVIAKSKTLDKEAVAFLVTYALPLLAQKEHVIRPYAMISFLLLAVIVLYRLQVAHVNPLLALVGYRFFEVSPKSGETALLITKDLDANGSHRVVQLTRHIWLGVSREP